MAGQDQQLTTIPPALMKAAGLDRAAAMQVEAAVRETGQPLRRIIDRLGLVTQKDWTAAVAAQHGLAVATLDDIPEILPHDGRLSADYLARNAIVPISLEKGAACFAVADPDNRQAVAALRMLFGQGLTLMVATDADIEAAFARSSAAASRAAALDAEVSPEGARIIDLDAARLKELANDAPTIRFLGRLFARAIEMRATDIHVEMLGDGPRIRLRVDGDLIGVEAPAGSLYQGVVSRLKILAGMDISERRLPQDGRIRQTLSGRDVDMRVASTPTIHGESLVLRLLDASMAPRAMDDLEMPEGVTRTFRSALNLPDGLILVTGPTGSGKTTTLHAALNAIKTPRRKIVTIEDPVEIQSEGLVQIEVMPDIGFTFAAALRTLLRHNPDVMMVGEIRDAETAELAVRSAMTGHLVLSTLHTNRAADAPLRLIDMGVPGYLVSSVLRMAAAQRLVRRLCAECSEPLKLADCERQQRLHMRVAGLDPALGPPEHWQVRRAVGCEACAGSGFHGRLPIFETIDAAEIARLTANPGAPYRTMWVEGLHHVASGRTTLQELVRVLGLERMRG